MANDLFSRSWIEICVDSLRKNVLTIRETVGKECRIIPMIKADAYGLGVENVLTSLGACEPWGFGVATVEEGCQLRNLGVHKPIVVFSPITYESYEEALRANLTISVSSIESLDQWLGTAKKLKVCGRFHIEIDTGMGRAGFDWKTVEIWKEKLGWLAKDEYVIWEGTYTHFHSSGSDIDVSTQIQYQRFCETKVKLSQNEVLYHVCNSAAILGNPAFSTDAVRPGMFIYGGQIGSLNKVPEAVVSLRARVVLVRDVGNDTTLGYGATYQSQGKEKWAVLGLGYGDGLPRRLGNHGYVLLQGVRVPIIGRVSMDTIVVNVSNLQGVKIGDIATLIGEDGEQIITLEEVADVAETVNYEILTGLTSRLPRVLV